MKIKITGFVFFFVVPLVMMAQMNSPFNKLPLVNQNGDYSFIVSGHFHGASNNTSTFPASTLLAGIDSLNSLKPAFLMSLGDMFLDVDSVYIKHYQASLFDKLHTPLFNAVGNHDIANGNLYEKVYGKSFYYFSRATELFIVLNTEVNDGSIKGEQLEMFKKAMNKAKAEGIKNVFVFSHRPVWSEVDPVYKGIFVENTQSRFGSPNFESEIKPLLQVLKLPVYWISGSMGSGPACFFYDKNQTSGITFIQTAIRDTPRDAVLLVTAKNGNISLQGVSLTGQQLLSIQEYNLDFWKERNRKPEALFNWRLLPYLTYLMIMHHYFWIGIATGIILLFSLTALMKKWKRRK